MIASEALKAQRHLSRNPNLAGHHTYLETSYDQLIHWAGQFDLPVFVTNEGAQITYKDTYLGRQITITLKAKS